MKKMKWMGLLLIPMMLGLAFAACSSDPPPQGPILRLNEINGTLNNTNPLPDRVFIEMINIGDEPMSLEGVSIWMADPNFNQGVIQESWVGEEGDTIAAGGFFVISGRQNRTTDPPEGQIFPGLSSSRALTWEIRDVDGEVLDRFHRAGDDDAMNELFDTDVFASSVGKVRIPDGTGNWYFYTGRVRENADGSGSWVPLGTPGAANPTSTAGLIRANGNTALDLGPWLVPQD